MCVCSIQNWSSKSIQNNWVFLSVYCFHPKYNSQNSHVWEARKYSQYTKFHNLPSFSADSITSSVHDQIHKGHTTLVTHWVGPRPFLGVLKYQNCDSSHWSKRTGIQQPTQPVSWLCINGYALYSLHIPATTVSGSFLVVQIEKREC